MNRMDIIGNLTRNPEARVTPGGTDVCSFTVAVNKRSSSDHPEADYIRVSAFGELSKRCAQYLSKGKKVFCSGRAEARAWTDQHGEMRCAMEIVASSVEFLSPRGEAAGADATPAPAPAAPVDPQSGFAVADEDVPF